MNKVKKQHTVPQCYLRRFTNSAGKLFAYDKKADRVYPTTTVDAAQEAYFYDFPPDAFAGHEIDVQTVEKFLSAIEAQYSPLLSELIASAESGTISHELIAEFSPYVVLQWMRTRTFRDTAFELMSKVSQDLADTLVDANFPGEKVRVTMGKELLPVLHAQQFLDVQRVAKMAHAIDAHIWVVGINRTPRHFYTSDHPVVRRANVEGPAMFGADAPGVEFVFPLSSMHVLLIMERTHFAGFRMHDNGAIELSELQVDDYNRLQVIQSSQRLYCAADDFDLARQTCREYPLIRDPDRPRVKVESTPIKDMRNYVYVTALE